MSNKKDKAPRPSRIPAEEWDLICRARTGDGRAFELLIAQYSKRIYNIGLKMLGSSEDAADMTQETLLKAYRNLPRFRGESAFFSWLYQIAVNTCRDMMRSAYRRHENVFSDTDYEDAYAGKVADYAHMPESVYTEKETNAYLQALIDGLTPQYRLAVTLREIAGLSYADIAEVTGVSIGTVKSRLSRARAAMQKQLAQDMEQYPDLLRLIGKGGVKGEM